MVMVQTGRVIDGKVVVDDDTPLPEGQLVGVLVHGKEDDFELSPEEEDRIAKAVAQIDRGEGIPVETVRAKIRLGK